MDSKDRRMLKQCCLIVLVVKETQENHKWRFIINVADFIIDFANFILDVADFIFDIENESMPSAAPRYGDSDHVGMYQWALRNLLPGS